MEFVRRALVRGTKPPEVYCCHRTASRFVRLFCCASSSGVTLEADGADVSKQFLSAMRLVPSPDKSVVTGSFLNVVVVVTASDGEQKRGVTCSSFTSVSRVPPILSFCVQTPSRMHELLQATRRFAVHVLSQNQMHYSIHFARPATEHKDQFDSIPHQLGLANVPLLANSCAVLQCEGHSVHRVGDHHVWYGEVIHVAVHNERPPLLYYARSYRSLGDEAFMSAFEAATLGYEEWTHEAHMRMAWNYIVSHGKQEATPLIKNGIKNYIDSNIGKVKNVYNETVTSFFIHMVDKAIQEFGGRPHSFEEFLASNPHLMDVLLLSQYYSSGRVNSQEARARWLEPDLQPLP